MLLLTVSRAWRWCLIFCPFLVVALAFQSLWAWREDADRPDSADLSVQSDRVAQLADAYIHRVVGVTSHLAITPDVMDLAASSRDRPISEEDKATDRNWLSSANTETGRYAGIRNRQVSRFFADVKATDNAYREIFLTDSNGRVLAASNLTENYLQNNDPWWKELHSKLKDTKAPCRRLPMSCVYLGKIEWDASAGVFGYDVVLPVSGNKGQVVGVLKAVIDPDELDKLLKFATLSQGLEVTLIDSDGKQIFSRKPFFPDKAAVPRLAALPSGNEGSWSLSKDRQGGDGPVAFIRRLSSPVEGSWFVAVVNRDQDRGASWKSYALWFLFILAMFLITAGAFAVRVPAEAEEPMEHQAI